MEMPETENKKMEGAARWSTEQLLTLIETAPVIICRSDLQAKVTYVNKKFEEVTGYSRDEVLDKPWFALGTLSAGNVKLLLSRMGKKLQGSPPQPMELKIRRKDGEWIWVTGIGEVIREGGKPAGFQVIAQDITERKRVEEGMERAAGEWRKTFDAISDLISIHDSNYKITRVNRAFAKVFGMEPKEVIGKTCYEVVHGKSEPPLHCPHKRALETGKPETVEFFEPNLGIYLEVSVSPVFNEKGKVVRIVHIAKDITERKKMEEELRESEERYRALLRLGGKVGEAIVMLQDTNLGEGIQVFANNEWSDITGYSEEELQAMSFFSLLHPRHRKASVERHRRKISGEDIPSLFVMSIIRKDGTEVPVELTSAYTTYKGERANVAYIRDITERNKMEEQLIVTDRLASVGELVSGVAHEVNNPLTSIVGFSELLLAANVPDAVKEDLKVINREAQRASGIVRNLLTFARRHNPEKQMVDVNDTIQAVLDLRTYEEKVNNIMAIKYFASDLPKITADGFQLRQVFLNLIINAEYFMIESHGKGTLSIKTERDRDIIRISFTDDGPGILEENAKHLFDPFFTTKEVGKGTGLGLSICHGIITEHGGRIYAKSGLGKGATFVVELPIRQQ